MQEHQFLWHGCSVKHNHIPHLMTYTFLHLRWDFFCFVFVFLSFFWQYCSLAALYNSDSISEGCCESKRKHIYSRYEYDFQNLGLNLNPILPNQRHSCHIDITDKCCLTILLFLLHYIFENIFQDLIPLITHSFFIFQPHLI